LRLKIDEEIIDEEIIDLKKFELIRATYNLEPRTHNS
jgi:hypothetical protein